MTPVPAAAQALQILSYLGRQVAPVRAGAVARDLGLPRSTTYHLLDTLQHSGFVVHLPEDQRYGLGVAAYELGAGYTRQAPLSRLARQPLAALVRHTGHSAHLVVLDGRDGVYVIEERMPGRPPLVTDVGVRLPAHLTASGRAILAALTPGQVRALYPDAASFAVRNDSTGPGSPSALRQLLVDVRRRGYATENGEVTAGFASVAAVVADHTSHPVAAVAVTYPAGEDVDLAAVVAATVRTAAEVTKRLAPGR